ncbi:hypothetical protein [Pseudomonas aeruginosa]|uniref:hypothetical protein n=1 Tax=Pseudomonas aeruginosa TaxID=287 RepID=UPI000B5A97AE|nr:hypothetical protein [Pseudomonas aeruginosa]ASJ88560.1 hypothetical protein PSA83_06434 [Pseudomonas aeruginosa]MBO8337299.1 hypothetical protein [Pseudomonas aeruginosa]HCF4079504.1 hypothetical protein [Pseudomonas aeruginosa]
MDKRGGGAFLLGFMLAAVPLTIWLLSLGYADNSSEFALACLIQFISGFAVRALYLRRLRAKKSDKSEGLN